MPRRSQSPGLKRGRNNLPYWIARQVVRDPMGFPDRCIPLPADASDERLSELCQQYTARLLTWIETERSEHGARLGRYDGTVQSACRLYQTHPASRFHKVKHNTRRSYLASLTIIEQTVGRRLIRNVTTVDVERWYDEWRKPVARLDRQGSTVFGPERIDRAHDAVSMLRTVLWFVGRLRNPDCQQLADELRTVKFEKGGAREQEMTFSQAATFVRTALELGRKGRLPPLRARSLAIAVAAQFETLLRQKDIIGEWAPYSPLGKPALVLGTEMWTGFFTWESIPGWRWRTKTSKSKYRAAAEFDLTRYSLLMPLLEAVPHAERTGAIVKDEHGLPVRESSFRKWFRSTARAAGIPDEVWLMDSRAGGATEAEEAGAAYEDIQHALTHSKGKGEGTTTLRYIRRRSRRIAEVAEARRRSRSTGSKTEE